MSIRPSFGKVLMHELKAKQDFLGNHLKTFTFECALQTYTEGDTYFSTLLTTAISMNWGFQQELKSTD